MFRRQILSAIKRINLKNTNHLKPLLSQIITSGFLKHKVLLTEFVNTCFHLGSLQFAVFTLQHVKNRTFLQNLLLQNLCSHALYDDVLSVFKCCRALNFKCDDFTFPSVIKACSKLGSFELGRQAHCVVLKHGYQEYAVVQTCLVDFYSKCGFVSTARDILDRIWEPGLVSWNALINGYAMNGYDERAVDVFIEVCEMGLVPNESTLASVIPVCTRVGYFGLGKCLHGFAVKAGFLRTDFLLPAFVSMYAGKGDLFSARALFEGASERSVEVWNAMISAYSQKQRFFDAVELYRQMLRADVRPDSLTFVSVIPARETCGDLRFGEFLHACAIKYGFGCSCSVSTALVSMYVKLGLIWSAKFIFDQMPQRNLLSWNTMMSGFVHNGLCDESLAAFRAMQLAGFSPDAVSVISILSACSKLKDVMMGKSAHAFSIRRNFDVIPSLSNALLVFYSDCHQLSTSFKLFHQLAIKSSVSWNCLISGCVRNGGTEKALCLLHEMQNQGIKMDLVTLISFLPGFGEAEYLGQGMAVHGYAIKAGFSNDISLLNALVSMYFKCGDPAAGMFLFEAMPEKDVVSWTVLISGCRHNDLNHDALHLFRKMMEDDIMPNYVLLLSVLPVCCTQLQGKSVHAFAIKTGVIYETPLVTSLILMYAGFGKLKTCLLLFKMGDKGDISLWNSLISSHVQAKNPRSAVALFCDLLEMGVEPDNITVLGLISACVQLSSLSFAHTVMGYVIRKGFFESLLINNALIDLYARCGNVTIAQQLFEQLAEKNADSWNIMINAYGLQGNGKAAVNFFYQMEQRGETPNPISYLSVLSACSHAGLVEQANRIFSSMVRSGISPTMEHYACMVDLLGRTGHLSEAFDLINRSPIKPSAGVLESFLGACLTHGNVELGEKIGRMLTEIDPDNSRCYVMLHNIYAAAGRWTDANKVRNYMEERRLKKMPGFSYVAEMVS